MEQSTEVQTLVNKIKKRSNIAKWGIGMAAVLLLAPLVWYVAYAVLGAAFLGLSLAVAGVVGLAIIHFTPVVMMKLENAKINAIMAEANKNPIPTLWNEYEKDVQEADEFQQSIQDYSAEIENVKSKRDKLASKLTEKDLSTFDADIAAMQEDCRLQEQELLELRITLQRQQTEIERAAAIWDLGMAVNKANSKNQAAQRESTLSRIRKETALDSVTANLNRGKAALRQRINSRRHLAQNENTKSIGHQDSSMIIDSTLVTEAKTIGVSR